MAGIWESQNKVIPAAYINLVTNTPLSSRPETGGTDGAGTGTVRGR